jgi:hypothetical protein
MFLASNCPIVSSTPLPNEKITTTLSSGPVTDNAPIGNQAQFHDPDAG